MELNVTCVFIEDQRCVKNPPLCNVSLNCSLNVW